MIYIFTGPPGSGKSTQSRLLAEHLQIPEFSMGEMLNQRAKTDATLYNIICRGDLVSEDYIKPELQQIHDETEGNAIIDAFPRTPEQAALLTRYWPKETIMAFRLCVPNEVIYDRISHRFDADGGRRKDDTPEVLKHRLELYYQLEKQLEDNLAHQGIHFINIDGDRSVEVINEAIQKLIHEHDHTA